MSDQPQATPHLTAFSSLRWWRMAQKELREILRDRRTIITLVAMPLLIYPLLGVTFQKLLVSQAASKIKIEFRVGLANQHDARIFRRIFDQAQFLREKELDPQDQGHHEAKG